MVFWNKKKQIKSKSIILENFDKSKQIIVKQIDSFLYVGATLFICYLYYKLNM